MRCCDASDVTQLPEQSYSMSSAWLDGSSWRTQRPGDPPANTVVLGITKQHKNLLPKYASFQPVFGLHGQRPQIMAVIADSYTKDADNGLTFSRLHTMNIVTLDRFLYL